MLIPIYLFYFIKPDGDSRIIGLFFFALAISTDWLDGFLARRTKITEFGVFLDPFVDRLLIASFLILIYLKGIMPLWSIALLLGRDLVIILGHTYLTLYRNVKLKVSVLGKITTAVIMVSAILLILGMAIYEPLTPLGRWLFFLALIMSLISGLQYLKWGIKAFVGKGTAIERVTQ